MKMEKISNYFKNKSIGYFIAAGTALVSLILTLIFFATFSNPSVAAQMGSKATGYNPETIGIFLLAGFVVEVIVLIVPQYRFVQLAAIAMFGLAFYKEVVIIPDFIVGKINNVEYNGGNFGLNMFYFITLFIILVASIIPAFMGFYKKEEEATEDMKVKDTAKIIKVASSAVVVVAAVLASTLVAGALTSKTAGKNNNNNQNQKTSSSSKEEKPKKDPINERIRAAAEEVDYDYKPNEVIIKEEEKYEFSAPSATAENPGYYNPELANLKGKHSKTRDGYYLVYVFEGLFSEGYQGGYDSYSASLYLWNDGLYTGDSNGTKFSGYWYNSSIDYGTDEEGNDIADCVNMVSGDNNFTYIQTDPVKGFYQRQGYVYINPGWGKRSVVVTGYIYYPDVAIFIDTDGIESFKVGDVFNREMDWTANKVIKNLTYTPIVETGSSKVNWTYPDGMLDENNKFTAAGEYEIKAKWGSFEDSVTITVE